MLIRSSKIFKFQTDTLPNRQPLSGLQEELKEAKIKLENYSFPLDMEISELKQENERLKAALTQSIELIKQWHDDFFGLCKKGVKEEIWIEYYENAPEMKLIREALNSLI